MKNIIYIVAMLIVSCSSSVEPIVEPSYNMDSYSIKMDLEDHVYKYQDTWLSWNRPFVDCNPDIQPSFSYQNSNLIISYCNSIGEIVPSSVILNNSSCSSNISEEDINVGNFITTLEFMVDEELIMCTVEKNDILLLSFDVKSKN